MKSLLKKLSLLLALIMCISLTACALGDAPSSSGNGSSDETNGENGGDVFKIGYANSGDTDVFDKMKKDEFEKITKDDASIHVTFTEANMDIQKQLDQMENFISQDMDLIIAVPVDYAGIEPGVVAANNAGIPVICLGIESGGGDFIFVGCQNRDAGVLQAEYMAEKLTENAKVLYLSGTPGLYHSIEREEGFTETINEKRPDIEILASQTGEYTRAEGQQVVEDWTQAFPEFDAVIAADDQMALGAVYALEGADKLDGVLVAGVDAISDAIDSIKAGELSMSVLQSAPILAETCYNVAKDVQSGKDVDNRVIVDFKTVTIDNVADFD